MIIVSTIITGREQSEIQPTHWWVIWDEFTTDDKGEGNNKTQGGQKKVNKTFQRKKG